MWLISALALAGTLLIIYQQYRNWYNGSDIVYFEPQDPLAAVVFITPHLALLLASHGSKGARIFLLVVQVLATLLVLYGAWDVFWRYYIDW